MGPQSDRLTLKNFLKAKRALVTPESVGLPRGQRRRTPGLRREEVATIADVGVTWYTWLEQGRPIHPSAETLHRIAEALQLSQSDEGYLFALAGLPRSEPAAPAFQVTPEISSVLESYRGPAFIINAISDILAFNAIAERLYKFVPKDDPQNGRFASNQLWQLFMSPDRRRLYQDYETLTRQLVALVRFNAASHQNDPRYREVVDTLLDVSPEFQTIWNEQHTASATPITVRMNHPEFGSIKIHSQRFLLVGEQGGMIVFLVPADQTTRDVFARLSDPWAAD